MAPAGRLLQLLSLLQSRPVWTGLELAERMGVTERTVRRDITRMRDLGYSVDSDAGIHGGYRLAAGANLPPLILQDEEAIAAVVGLRLLAGGMAPGLEDAAVGALGKVDQLLPPALRRKVQGFDSIEVEQTGTPAAADPVLLAALAQACRGSELLRLTYRGTERTVEPYRLTLKDGRWYLLCRYSAKGEWRTLRVDGVTAPLTTGQRFARRRAPASASADSQPTRRAVVLARARHSLVRAHIPPAVGSVRRLDDTTCEVTIDSEDLRWLQRFLLRLPFEVEALEPRELRTAFRALGRRLAAAHS